MVKVDKKYIKLGVAGLAVVALVIGLSVGLTRNNSSKSNTAAASSNASGNENIASDFDEEMLELCSPSSSAKSGKSGGGKSGKSGGSGSGSRDDGVDRRLLVVPGTEDYHAQQQLEAGDKAARRTLRNELVRELQTGSSGKSGKSGGSSDSVTSDDLDPKIRCRKPKDICGEFTTSFTSDDSSSSKSGKSGGGKSGKSGGDMSYGKSGKSGGGKSGKSGGSGSYDPCGKSGKSGGGKSGKSGDSDSGSGDSDDCPSIAPTVCDSNSPTYLPTYLPTECICEEQAYYINVETLECTRGCGINCDSLPDYPEGGIEGTCRERGFDSRNRCIEECTSWFGNGVECTENDTCDPVETTPVPTPSPTEGGTTTVSAEKTGPPTRSAPEV